MVISGIVRNNHHASPASRTTLSEVFEKRMERHSVKLLLLSSKNQFPVAQSDRSKIPHTFTCGMVQQDRVPLLRRNPHQTAGPILLKMDFIRRPQIDSTIGGEPPEFFYMPPEAQDWPGQSEGAVYADETQRI
jgi:hypothetical protein